MRLDWHWEHIHQLNLHVLRNQVFWFQNLHRLFLDSKPCIPVIITTTAAMIISISFSFSWSWSWSYFSFCVVFCCFGQIDWQPTKLAIMVRMASRLPILLLLCLIPLLASALGSYLRKSRNKIWAKILGYPKFSLKECRAKHLIKFHQNIEDENV